MAIMSARPRRLIAAALSLVMIFVATTIADTFIERMRAEQLLIVFSRIHVGTTPTATAKQLVGPFTHYKWPDDLSDGKSGSGNLFTFSNRVLNWLHLPASTIVWATLEYENGVVVKKSFQCYQSPRHSGSISESVMHTVHAPGKSPDGEAGRDIGIGGDEASLYFVIQVRDDTSVSLARRQLDWQLDLSCMTALEGCKDSRKVLRGVFPNR